MDDKDFSKLTDQELLTEKKKHKNSKIVHAVLIGFLAGVLIFGLVAWILNPEKHIGFLLPMLILVIMIYKFAKKPKEKSNLEEVLKKRNLS